MRIFEKIAAEAQPGVPFSNGTMSDMWMDRWCYAGCVREPDCPLLLIALEGHTPSEWRVLEPERHQDYHCVEFRRTL